MHNTMKSSQNLSDLESSLEVGNVPKDSHLVHQMLHALRSAQTELINKVSFLKHLRNLTKKRSIEIVI